MAACSGAIGNLLSDKENRLQTFWKVEVPLYNQSISEADRNDLNNP